MNNLYTIGFTKKTAEEFFEALKNRKVAKLLDVRLNNKSQLAGFAKSIDLKYFLKIIANIEYIHLPEFAPTQDLLKGYRNKEISWESYEKQYLSLIKKENKLAQHDKALFHNACFLCSEETAERCHRRLLAEYISDANRDVEIVHI